MLELSLHILDIAENSTRAGAKNIEIEVNEDTMHDRLSIRIADDGSGMTEEAVQKALDPFYTTKKVRRVGLGLPMLADAAQRTGGKLILTSKIGAGTKVEVIFGLRHIDRQPLGNIAGTLMALIAGGSGVDILYRHERDGNEYLLDTKELKKELDGVPIDNVEVLNFIKDNVNEGLREIGAEA